MNQLSILVCHDCKDFEILLNNVVCVCFLLVFWELVATLPQDFSSITRNGHTFNETR